MNRKGNYHMCNHYVENHEQYSDHWEISLGHKFFVVGMLGQASQEYHVCKHFLNLSQCWWEITECSKKEIKESYKFLDKKAYPLGETLHGFKVSHYSNLFPQDQEAKQLTSDIYKSHYMPIFRKVIEEYAQNFRNDDARFHFTTTQSSNEEVAGIITDPKSNVCVIFRAHSNTPQKLVTRTCYRTKRKTAVRIDEAIASLTLNDNE